VLISVLAIAMSACGGSKKVGGSLTFRPGHGSELGRFASSAPPKTKTSVKPKATTSQQAKVNQKEQDKKNASVIVKITKGGYDPYVIQAFAGSIILFQNADTVPHTATGDNNEFDSGTIAPGDQWPYHADTVGKYNFHDDTRPYVVGNLQVVAK
jgi:plastocyanin